ncbi:MAG: hypothetical protein U5J98_12025 [Halobacteriales archaeon]|nr:hypothetical protein [Halobacteriales archaeon]
MDRPGGRGRRRTADPIVMSLSDRQLRYLAAAGMLLVLLGTPLAVIFAIDFKLVVMSGSAEGIPFVAYDALEPAAQAAFQ